MAKSHWGSKGDSAAAQQLTFFESIKHLQTLNGRFWPKAAKGLNGKMSHRAVDQLQHRDT